MQAYEFSGITKHGKVQFDPGAKYGFEDQEVADYFVKCGWASPVAGEPGVIYEVGELKIDPETRHNETGLIVKDMVINGQVEVEG